MSNDDELLECYRAWLLKTAWEYARTPDRAQELAQEGWIAMWRALRSKLPDGVRLRTHLMKKARWRIIEVVRQGNLTGKPSQTGKKYSEGTPNTRERVVVVDTTQSYFDAPDSTVLDDVATAYHHGEIIAAINSLPVRQRELVYERFWCGVYDPKNSGWWYRPKTGARARLHERLQHLEGLIK